MIITPFYQECLSRLRIKVDDPQFNTFLNIMRWCSERGFSVADTVKFVKHTEEYNPDMSEEHACMVMSLIANKYR